MKKWKIQLVVMTFCVLVQTSKGWTSANEEERQLSTHWQDESVNKRLISPLETLMKRSKALRFYGLMGRRAEPKIQFQAKKRNKGEAFVGLMGRSVSSEEPLNAVIPYVTTEEIHDPEKPSKQGPLKEWIHISY
ncbi:uncharacterized protein LOC119792885 isoform X2 [Cyprinodon tularosa]|uniref:uncharacterized protein LOC119792885 isoform X2 n=1 Tax=Cyprinodon tularosa TaxID=77115 RepID=UPI0018E21915|nr:uncharacterized protein LOC119792885 isoform X2 [Cyprinodon tularosa]